MARLDTLTEKRWHVAITKFNVFSEVVLYVFESFAVEERVFNALLCTLSGDANAEHVEAFWPGFAKNQRLLPWYREAELAHGRVCMLAVLGYTAPQLPTGADAVSLRRIRTCPN